jgi:hypothetical protein
MNDKIYKMNLKCLMILLTNNNEPLKNACVYDNLEMVDYWLNYGLEVDNSILEILFEKFNQKEF